MRSVFRTRRSRVLARVLLYGGLVFVGLPFAFSQVMIGIHRGAISARPAPGYEQVPLVSDGLKLRAWLGRGRRERAAFVVVHGLGDDLESYLDHARPLRARGHTVLLVDLRGHGGSEGSFTTLGGLESHDVRAAMRYLREAGLAPAGFGLMGASMGAVAVLLAAAEEPDVRVVVAEAPYDTFRNSIRRHARLLYHVPPWLPLVPLAIRFAEWRAGFSADAIDCVAAARRTRAPLLAIVDGADERMPEAVVRRVVEAHAGVHRLWVAPGAAHVEAILDPGWQPVV
ncbi:MAG: alpha/beta hydrolase, partial [Betaproteobacteria bacterium]